MLSQPRICCYSILSLYYFCQNNDIAVPLTYNRPAQHCSILSGLFLKDPQTPEDDLDLSSEDEAVASDLDMHSLILGSLNQDTEPLKTADEVIREIDDMMQDDCSVDGSLDCNEVLEKAKEVLSSPLYEDSKLLSIKTFYVEH